MKLAFLSPFTTSVLNELIPELKRKEIPQGTGGSAVFELVLGLNEIPNIELHLITFQPGLKKTLKYKNNNLFYYLIPYREKGATVTLWSNERKLVVETLKEIRPDVIHAHWTYEYALSAFDYNKDITLVTCHDIPSDVLKYTKNIFYLPKFITSQIIFKKALWLSFVSPFVLESTKKYLNKNANFFIIPNIVDIDNYDLDKSKNKFKILPKKYIISIGLWNKLKNIKNGVKAFNKLINENNKFKEYHYLLVGNGLGENEAANLWALKNNLEENIHFIGNCSRHDTLFLISRAEIMLHPSKTESFGLAIGEALAYNKKIIAGKNSGGIPWLLGYGKYGLICNINSIDELKSNIILAIKEKNNRSKYYITNNYNTNTIVSKYLNVYNIINDK